MSGSTVAIPSLWKESSQIACCMLLFWCAAAAGQENHSTSPASETVEQQALNVVNDSDWAHTVTPTTQDTPCSYQNPAFPGLYPEDKAAAVDAAAPVMPTDVPKPDGSEYLVRFQSAKPVQAAVQQLLAMGEKWSAYGPERRVSETDDERHPSPEAHAVDSRRLRRAQGRRFVPRAWKERFDHEAAERAVQCRRHDHNRRNLKTSGSAWCELFQLRFRRQRAQVSLT